jgi:hypothetical protein
MLVMWLSFPRCLHSGPLRRVLLSSTAPCFSLKISGCSVVHVTGVVFSGLLVRPGLCFVFLAAPVLSRLDLGDFRIG